MARKDFFELAAYARKRVDYLSIASNGTLITPDNAKRIKDAGVDYVEISLDGATPSIHDSFRGIPGAYERTIEGIKNSLSEGIDTCIATVFHRDNLKELDKLVGLSKELDTRFMHFNYIPTGRARAHFDLDLTPKERFFVLETLGKEILGLYMRKKEEELKTGKSNIKVDRFFSTCPQFASVTKMFSKIHGEDFIVEAHYAQSRVLKTLRVFWAVAVQADCTVVWNQTGT